MAFNLLLPMAKFLLILNNLPISCNLNSGKKKKVSWKCGGLEVELKRINYNLHDYLFL